MRSPTARTINGLALGYVGHNLALLALPVLLAALALAWPPRRWWLFAFWSRGATAGVNVAQALNVWIIQAVLAIGPPLGAMIFMIYIKTDWGIPLFFLAPLALVAIPGLRLRRIALFNLAAIWLVISLLVLAASPRIVAPGKWRESQRGRLPGAVRARARADRVVARAVSSRAGPSSQPTATPTRPSRSTAPIIRRR